MPKYLITETRREIWQHYYEIEADSADEAEELWKNGAEGPVFEPEHIDTIDSGFTIEELPDEC